MRFIKTTLIILLGSSLLYNFRGEIISFVDPILNRDKVSDLAKIEESINIVKEKIVEAPKPLINKIKGEDGATLSIEGVLKYTNEERAKIGLEPLTLNQNLSVGASAKADDMFQKQYFEHESPDGKGPADVATAAGYDFLIIGENLALGGFKSDKDLVDAWMASPGHRENILRKDYKEIGISVKKGKYEGEEQWMAVQEFGTPASLCKKPGDALYERATLANNNLESLRDELTRMKETIDGMNKNSNEYREKVDDYNALVRDYNALVSETKDKVDEYNSLVKKYNECIKGYTG